MTDYTLYVVFIHCCVAYGVGFVLRFVLYCADYRHLPSTTRLAELAFASLSMPLAVLVIYWVVPLLLPF